MEKTMMKIRNYQLTFFLLFLCFVFTTCSPRIFNHSWKVCISTTGYFTSNTHLSKYIINGDFSYPSGILSFSNNYAYFNTITGQYAPILSHRCSLVPDYDQRLFGWRSTQGGGEEGYVTERWEMLELQRDLSGNIYAELAASKSGYAIYQDISTVPGSLYKWSLKHASIYNQRIDYMTVMIGSPLHQEKQEATRTSVNGNGDKVGPVGTRIGTITTNTDERDHEGQWERYEGVYLVPENQTVTRFTFQDITPAQTATGNLLDDVTFEIAHRVDYDLQGGISEEIYRNPTENNYIGYHVSGKTVVLSTSIPTKEGYTFLGWSFEKVNDILSFDDYNQVKEQLIRSFIMPDESVMIYAVWSKNYEVQYDSNSGNGSMDSQSFSYGKMKSLSKNLFTKEGFTFLGWSTTPNGKVEYQEEESVQNLVGKDIVLYAVWQINRYPYQVEYYYDGRLDSSKTETSNAPYHTLIKEYIDKSIPGYQLSNQAPKPFLIDCHVEKNTMQIYYTKISFGITTKVNGFGGTIIGNETIFYGEDSTEGNIRIKAKEGYYISKIIVNDREVLVNEDETLMEYILDSFKNIHEEKVVSVNFQQKEGVIICPISNTKVKGTEVDFLVIILIILFVIYRIGICRKRKIN